MARSTRVKRKQVTGHTAQFRRNSTLTSYRSSSVCTVTILVGSDQIPFNVHKDQLCEASAVFRAAFISQYKESPEEKTNLPEEDVDMVDLFVQWLYKQDCEIIKLPANHDIDGGEFLELPVRSQIFADKYNVPNINRYCLQELLAYARSDDYNYTPTEKAIEHVYRNTCPGSGVRRLMANFCASLVPALWFEGEMAQYWLREMSEFAVDLIVALANVSSKKNLGDPLSFNEPEYCMGVGEESSEDI